MNKLELEATEERQRINGSVEAARQRARAERLARQPSSGGAVAELMRRNPGGTARLVGDLMTFTEIEEV